MHSLETEVYRSYATHLTLHRKPGILPCFASSPSRTVFGLLVGQKHYSDCLITWVGEKEAKSVLVLKKMALPSRLAHLDCWFTVEQIKILNMGFPFPKRALLAHKTNLQQKPLLHVPFTCAMPPSCGLHNHSTTSIFISLTASKANAFSCLMNALLLFVFERYLLHFLSRTN